MVCPDAETGEHTPEACGRIGPIEVCSAIKLIRWVQGSTQPYTVTAGDLLCAKQYQEEFARIADLIQYELERDERRR